MSTAQRYLSMVYRRRSISRHRHASCSCCVLIAFVNAKTHFFFGFNDAAVLTTDKPTYTSMTFGILIGQKYRVQIGIYCEL